MLFEHCQAEMLATWALKSTLNTLKQSKRFGVKFHRNVPT